VVLPTLGHRFRLPGANRHLAIFVNPSFHTTAAEPPFVSFLAFLLAFYSIAAYGEERRAVVAGVIAGVVILAADILRLGAGVHPENIVPTWVFCGVIWFIGRTVRRSQVQAAQLRDLAAQLEVEREKRAQTAVAEERNRIARGMHDVVAHSVSVMVVQSQAAQRLLEGE
jgi:signal transduction histidine kinase